MGYFLISNKNELYHHGVLGMKWGIRRYQNKDGSLTEEGKKRYENNEKLYKEVYKARDDYISKMNEKKITDFDEIHRVLQNINELSDEADKKYWKYYEDKLGTDLFNKTMNQISETAYKIYDAKYDDYKGKYLNDYKDAEKQMNDLIKLDIDTVNKFAKEKNIDFYKARKQFNESKEGIELKKKLADARNNASEKARKFTDDWYNITINDILKSVPRSKRDDLYEFLKFNDWRI